MKEAWFAVSCETGAEGTNATASLAGHYGRRATSSPATTARSFQHHPFQADEGITSALSLSEQVHRLGIATHL